MVQIPAKSVAQELTRRINARSRSFKSKNPSHMYLGGTSAESTFIKNAAALAQLLADMLFDSKDSEAAADGNNVQIYFAAVYSPEFTTAHNNSPTHLHGEDIFIVHQGRKLYRYEYS